MYTVTFLFNVEYIFAEGALGFCWAELFTARINNRNKEAANRFFILITFIGEITKFKLQLKRRENLGSV